MCVYVCVCECVCVCVHKHTVFISYLKLLIDSIKTSSSTHFVSCLSIRSERHWILRLKMDWIRFLKVQPIELLAGRFSDCSNIKWYGRRAGITSLRLGGTIRAENDIKAVSVIVAWMRYPPPSSTSDLDLIFRLESSLQEIAMHTIACGLLLFISFMKYSSGISLLTYNDF